MWNSRDGFSDIPMSFGSAASRPPLATYAVRTGMGGSYGQYTPLPSGGASSGAGGSGGTSPFGSGSMSLSQLLAMQRAENAKTKAENIATRNATLGVIGGVPTAFQADPLWQATRRSAQRLVENPEALNDQTQQLIQNRAANQTNAAANTARDQMRRQLAAQGMLGSSAEQGALGQLERDRQASLADSATKLEIERAARRNQDILASQQMGAALAGQESGVNERMANTRAQTDLYFQPENLSGYAGYFAGQGSGGMFGGAGGTLKNQGVYNGENIGALNPWGRQSPGQTGFAPGLRGNYSWAGVGGGYQAAPGWNGLSQQPMYQDNTNYQRLSQNSVPYWQQKDTSLEVDPFAMADFMARVGYA